MKQQTPFSSNIDQTILIDIATGKSASEETANFLLNIDALGKSSREKFITECIAKRTRFEQKLTKQKVRTFATETNKFKLTSKTEKTVTTPMMRDLFGSILCVALKHKIDMSMILTYPLTPHPLSLSHTDGSM